MRNESKKEQVLKLLEHRSGCSSLASSETAEKSGFDQTSTNSAEVQHTHLHLLFCICYVCNALPTHLPLPCYGRAVEAGQKEERKNGRGGDRTVLCRPKKKRKKERDRKKERKKERRRGERERERFGLSYSEKDAVLSSLFLFPEYHTHLLSYHLPFSSSLRSPSTSHLFEALRIFLLIFSPPLLFSRTLGARRNTQTQECHILVPRTNRRGMPDMPSRIPVSLYHVPSTIYHILSIIYYVPYTIYHMRILLSMQSFGARPYPLPSSKLSGLPAVDHQRLAPEDRLQGSEASSGGEAAAFLGEGWKEEAPHTISISRYRYGT